MNKPEKTANHINGTYSFPEIPIENFSDEGERFRPIDFGENGEDRSGNLAGNGEIIEQIKKNAYVEGFDKGKAAGMEAVKEEIEPLLRTIQNIITELGNTKKEIYLNAEKDVLELILAVARKIVCSELKVNKTLVLNVIKEALKKLVAHEKISIKISPSDLQVIKDIKSEVLNSFDDIAGFTLEADETVGDGGCIIETKAGDIEARIEKQFEEVEEIFRQELQESVAKAQGS